MGVRRYAVIDSKRVCVNIILVDDPMPLNFWPGYGYALLDLGPADPNEPFSPPTILSCQLRILDCTPDKPLAIMDRITYDTGVVYKWEPAIRQAQDPATGETVFVSEAPDVRLHDERDEPTPRNG